MRAVERNAQKGGNGVIVKRIMCLATVALVAVLVLAPGALAQQDAAPGDDDPYLPEQNVVVVGHDELQQIAGQPLPQQQPAEPVSVPVEATLAQTGGPAILLPVAALLLGSGVLAAYAVLRRRSRR